MPQDQRLKPGYSKPLPLLDDEAVLRLGAALATVDVLNRRTVTITRAPTRVCR